MRLSGKICCECRHSLPHDPTHNGGERYCARCIEAREPKRRVYMSFMHNDGWLCRFLESDLKTSLPRKLTFATHEKVTEMVHRFGSTKNIEDKQALEHGIQIGRGGVYLDLTAAQYAELKKTRKR